MDIFYGIALFFFVLGLWGFDRKAIKNRKDIEELKAWCDKLEDRIIKLEVKNKRLRNAIKSLSKKDYMLTAEKKEDKEDIKDADAAIAESEEKGYVPFMEAEGGKQ